MRAKGDLLGPKGIGAYADGVNGIAVDLYIRLGPDVVAAECVHPQNTPNKLKNPPNIRTEISRYLGSGTVSGEGKSRSLDRPKKSKDVDVLMLEKKHNLSKPKRVLAPQREKKNLFCKLILLNSTWVEIF